LSGASALLTQSVRLALSAAQLAALMAARSKEVLPAALRETWVLLALMRLTSDELQRRCSDLVVSPARSC
jgi:hypothetical protein